MKGEGRKAERQRARPWKTVAAVFSAETGGPAARLRKGPTVRFPSHPSTLSPLHPSFRPLGIRVGVGAVVLDGSGRVLLVKHHPSDEPRKFFWKGRWICPGGMLDFGESLEEGARREVREETGLDIEIVRPLAPADRLILWNGRKYMQVVYIDFMARAARAPPRKGGLVAVRPGDDVAVCRWFGRAGLESLGDGLHAYTLALLVRAGLLDAGRG